MSIRDSKSSDVDFAPVDIRAIILAELERIDESHYWLAKKADQAQIANEQTIYRYLRGERDTAGKVIGGLLGLLKLKIPLQTAKTSKPKPALSRKRRKVGALATAS